MRFDIESFGKINLTLDVLFKRDDGYHEIKSIMQQISLSDHLRIEEKTSGVSIQCDNQNVPLDSNNLVSRAWEKMSKYVGTNTGINVIIRKNIPVAAGLAGGSGNGAATLVALNNLWGLKLDLSTLMEIGRTIGADIPFCLMGGTALAEGIGEKLTPIKSFKDKNILLVNPGIEISSAYAYSKLALKKDRIPVEKLVKCIENDNLDCIATSLSNVMEEAILPMYPIIKDIKDQMLELGAMGSLMSGSGSTVFGIYDDPEKVLFAKKKLNDKYPHVFSVLTL